MRILLVEDHEDTNRSLTNLLRRRGYHVQSALSFQSAVDLSAKEQFDVLISDLALPDGNGIDLIQKLHSKQPLLGIALTGFATETANARIIENNAFIVLNNSFLRARMGLPEGRCVAARKPSGLGPPGFEPGTKGL
ncbi:MAG: hypothetical protein DME92_11560 [Verrucomicrobia bacterium]|nr:MAG: hypothetical protein DME92_11560 [Verrucomicrobiota bacterium]